jgi:D-alanine-D-alanine ligase
MNVTVLTYLEREDSKTYDAVVEQVSAALEQKAHTVSVLGVHADVKKLINGLTRRQPDLVFNLMEMFGDNVTGDVAVAGLLDLLQVPYTGCGPGELHITEDKALAKKILAFEGIAYPKFAVFSKQAELETGGNLRLPLFVKPLRMDASIGIETDSLVHDTIAMMQRIASIHAKVNDAALAEEYIEGREFYVGIFGNQELTALPPIEVDFSGLPEGSPHVLGGRAKWEKKSVEYKGTKSVVAELPDELRARLHRTALDAYRALRVRDYGRVDLRFTDTGDIYVIEVNPSCYLEKSSEFAMAAEAAGIEYPDLVDKIAQLAHERHRAAASHRNARKQRPVAAPKETSVAKKPTNNAAARQTRPPENADKPRETRST